MPGILDNKLFNKPNTSMLISRFRCCLGLYIIESELLFVSPVNTFSDFRELKKEVVDWFEEQEYTFLDDWGVATNPVVNNPNREFSTMFYFKDKELLLKFLLRWS